MKLKKLLAMLLALAMVFAFAACSKDDDDDKDEKESKKKASDTVKEDEDDSNKDKDADIDTPIEEEDGEEISGSKKTERELPGGSSGKKSGSVAPGEAEWEGHPGTPFADLFAKGITDANSDIDLSMSITMGWATSELDDSSFDNAWTFEFEMENNGETMYMTFFMEMDGDVLVAHGCEVIDVDGTSEFGTATEAEELINMFV